MAPKRQRWVYRLKSVIFQNPYIWHILGDAMGFYIENCRVANSAEVTDPVTSLSDISGVEIVKNSCYANLLNAQLENDPPTQKWDTEQVGMSYTSFVYGSNKEQSQSVWCEVKFCLKDSCPTDIPYDDASCPEDAILGYTAM